MTLNLERTEMIFSNWEELKLRLFVNAVNKDKVKENAANVKLTNDISLQLAILLNDETTPYDELIQASSPWKTFSSR